MAKLKHPLHDSARILVHTAVYDNVFYDVYEVHVDRTSLRFSHDHNYFLYDVVAVKIETAFIYFVLTEEFED